MQFPVYMEFKIAVTPQITVTDANGQLICYVRQKLFKLKENVKVFSDVDQTNQLFEINADKVIDYSPRFNFTDMMGQPIGSVKRQGRKSLWKARYDIFDGQQVVATIQEENPWKKVGDALFSEIPIVGLLAGYVFNPSYVVSRADGTPIVRVVKEKSLIGRRFTINELVDLPDKAEVQTILSILTMTLRERARG